MASVSEPTEILWDLRVRGLLPKPVVRPIDKSALLARTKPGLTYSALALAVLLPCLAPGYILTLDMAFTPNLRLPDHVSSSYLFTAGLHYLNLIIPSQIIQKLMLFSIILLSGLGMHYLVRHIQQTKDETGAAAWGAYVAGALYAVNPFTYSRFMAGQYAVLLGYALLPFLVRAGLQFFSVPTLLRAVVVSGWLTAISIVSLHTLGLAVIVLLVSFGVFVWRQRHNLGILRPVAWYGVVAVVLFIVSSGYWLTPLVTGGSNQAQAAASFGAADRQAFATAGGNAAAKLGNILQLQGFWAEGQGLYLLPADQFPGWPIVVLALWTLVGIGAVWLWRNHRGIAVIVLGSALLAIAIALFGFGGFRPLAGYREPQKFIGLLAMAYAICAGLGAAFLFERFSQRRIALTISICAVALLPVLLTPTMFWGFSGQLAPREYPADWYAMNMRLNQDPADFRVLSLPWHLYMHYQFAGRIILNPSDKFFDKPTIVSNELEYAGAAPTFPDADKSELTHQILPTAAGNPAFAGRLADLHVKYVLLSKTYDYRDYTYLDKQPNLTLLTETPNLKLYRNLAYDR